MDKPIVWTKSQLDALEARADKILVSAAAGSGKSTVLTERIIRAVTSAGSSNQAKPYDLDKIMVVTYTRASADDLKNKITNAIRKAVLAAPNDKHLASQLLKLPSAMINTIHGVCYSLIKKNFVALGLPASVSIADETRAVTLKTDTMNKLLDKCFAGEFSPIPDFAAFAENFIAERDEKLSDLLLEIYSKVKNDPDGITFKTLDYYGCGSKDILKTPFGKLITDRLRMLIDYNRYMLDEAEKYFASDEYYAPLIDFFEKDRVYAERIDNAIKLGDVKVLRDVLNSVPEGSSPSVPTDKQTETGEFYRKEKKAFRLKIQSIASSIFQFTDGELDDIAVHTRDIAEKLIYLLKEYDSMLTEAKQRHSIIDFNDIEHYALKLLYDENGEPSKLAHELSSSLDEIYVDEYQDLNPLQNKIFTALSVNCPIFMVGDIKQSIYGFRGADSNAFSSYKDTFTPYQRGVNSKTATVFLSDNFRSAKPITDFANVVSDAMFYTPQNDGYFKYRISYTLDDRLNCGAKFIGIPPKVTLMNCVRDMTDEETKKKNTYYVEANMVANEIAELIRNGTKPEEIAILLRSAKTTAPVMADALKSRNIPVSTSKEAPLLETPEIHLALCLLNCCDNPYRDIFLAGALRSPVFNFTLDEMVSIRRENPGATSLFSALTEYTEKHKFTKGERFLTFLEKMRKYSSSNTVDRILWHLYSETSLFTDIYDSGKLSESQATARRNNLLALHEMAKTYVDSGQNGLFGFLEQLRMLIENNESPSGAKADGNAVQIITMHSSKGLEFKYCFICATTNSFNTNNQNSDVIYDNELGLAMRIKDKDRLSSSDTPFRIALSYKTENLQRDEDMRMLYVALTRATTKLYICSSIAEKDKFDTEIDILSKIKHPYTFIRQNNHIKWIYTALNMINDIIPEYETVTKTQEEIFNESRQSVLTQDYFASSTILSEKDKTDLYDEFKRILRFEYPHKYSVILPSKLSVSSLKPNLLDSIMELDLGKKEALDIRNENSAEAEVYIAQSEENESTNEYIDEKNSSSKLDTPSFMLENVKPTGADKGTATHIFMQFCRFEKLNEGIENEIDYLVRNRFILEEHAKLINVSAINNFIKSDIFAEIKSSKEISREYRFNIKLPAADFVKTKHKPKLANEHVFVQGIIDCYFRDKNGDITLLDYKTDYVPRKIKGDVKAEDTFFIDRYKTQLSYYNQALEKLTKQQIKRTVIYSFDLCRCIEIPLD